MKHLVLAGPKLSPDAEVEFYGTLLKIRDKYFAAPREGLLLEYLLAADLIIATGYYRSRGVAGIGQVSVVAKHYARVERCASELEVLSLMDTFS